MCRHTLTTRLSHWIIALSLAILVPSGSEIFNAYPALREDIHGGGTDTQGVLHMTDRWESVPPPYRPQAKQDLPS